MNDGPKETQQFKKRRRNERYPFVRRAPLTKEVVRERLSSQTGLDSMMHMTDDAFPFAYELFCEGDGNALTFLCHCAKQARYLTRIDALLKEDTRPLYTALSAQNPKLRKNAALMMGQLCWPEFARPLAEALQREEIRYVRPTMLLSLGAIATEEAGEALEGYTLQPAKSEEEQVHFNAEAEALDKARRTFLVFDEHTFTKLPKPYEVILRCPDMLSGGLARELAERGIRPAAVHSADVHVHTDDLLPLYQCRCFSELLLEISANSNPDPKSIAIKAKPFLEQLLPACHTGRPPFGYRVELRDQSPRDRAEMIRKITKVLDGDILQNCPSNYEAELRIEIARNGGAFIYCKLYTIPDTRFAYRVKSLPASISPVTAAAVLRHVEMYLGSGARVLDPCCGSGTMLIERQKLMPCSLLEGVDISGEAIDFARENGEAAGCDLSLTRKDCRCFGALTRYDEVISNLPFGNRVGSHEMNIKLYSNILDRLPQWLCPGGIAVLYTMEYTLMKRLVRERPNLKLLTEAKTSAGGLMPAIFVISLGRTEGK